MSDYQRNMQIFYDFDISYETSDFFKWARGAKYSFGACAVLFFRVGAKFSGKMKRKVFLQWSQN